MNVKNPQVADKKDAGQFHPEDPWNPNVELPQGPFPKHWKATSAVGQPGDGAYTWADGTRGWTIPIIARHFAEEGKKFKKKYAELYTAIEDRGGDWNAGELQYFFGVDLPESWFKPALGTSALHSDRTCYTAVIKLGQGIGYTHTHTDAGGGASCNLVIGAPKTWPQWDPSIKPLPGGQQPGIPLTRAPDRIYFLTEGTFYMQAPNVWHAVLTGVPGNCGASVVLGFESGPAGSLVDTISAFRTMRDHVSSNEVVEALAVHYQVHTTREWGGAQ